MGWDICTFGKHGFDTSSVEKVARELSANLKVNIRYGYYNYYLFDKIKKRLTENENVRDFVCLGRVGKFAMDYYYELIDAYYQFKNIRRVIDEDDITKYKWQRKDFKYGNNKKYFLEKYEHSLNREHYSLYIRDRKYRTRKKPVLLRGVEIYNEIADVNYDFRWRWFGFAQVFTKANAWDQDYRITNLIRHDLKKYYNALGCNKIIYHPDQGAAQLISGKYEETWNDVLSYVKKKKYYDELLNLDVYDEEAKRLNRMEYGEKDMQLQLDIPTFFKKKRKLFPAYTEIEIFFDDFSDLEK